MNEPTKRKCLFQRITEQETEAKEFGFYWEHIGQLLEQIRSECNEVEESAKKNDRAQLQEEIGDLLSAAISLAVFCQMDPQETLLKSIEKFQKRYDALVSLVKKDGHENLHQQPFDVLMHYWVAAKKITT